MNYENSFSIVICTYNGAERVPRTLQAIASLQHPEHSLIEVIVVDNASTDHTEDVVQQIWKNSGCKFPLHYLKENRPGKGYAVETGYDAAQYQYILTVDDDNWLASNYLVEALQLLKRYPDIGILQGRSLAAFEAKPPDWFHELERYFIVGSPVKEKGYFPRNSFYVWGAGMIIRQTDWRNLRKLGFSFLTSKLPGKAAGEDNELAIGLLMMGRRIYYSDELVYHHYMPEARLKWEKLKQNFSTFGYVRYHIFLYAMIMDAHEKGYTLTPEIIALAFKRAWKNRIKEFTWKQKLYYKLRPMNDFYQLQLEQFYSLHYWFCQLSGNVMKKVEFLRGWMEPLLNKNPNLLKLEVKV